MNCSVTGIAANSDDAITLALQEKPDLILMDICLDGKHDGIYTAQRIKQYLDVPIIYISGYADDKIIDRVKKTFPSTLLSKPLKFIDLKSSVLIALEKHKLSKELNSTNGNSEIRTDTDLIQNTEPKIMVLCEDEQIRMELLTLLKNDKFEVCVESKSFFDALEQIYQVKITTAIVFNDLYDQDTLFAIISSLKRSDKYINIFVISNHRNEEVESKLIANEVNGFLLLKDCKEYLNRAIIKVEQGELYYSPQILTKYILKQKLYNLKFSEANVSENGNSLSDREKEIISFIVKDYKNREIGKYLFLSEKTIKAALTTIYKKLNVKNRKKLKDYALKHVI